MNKLTDLVWPKPMKLELTTEIIRLLVKYQDLPVTPSLKTKMLIDLVDYGMINFPIMSVQEIRRDAESIIEELCNEGS